MKIPFLDLGRQHELIKDELEATYKKVVDGNWFIGGEHVQRFEEEFANYVGVDYCKSCGNGTDGLELVLRAMEIGPGDEVILPSFTWVSDAEAVCALGAIPVLVDVDDKDLNISVDAIEKKVTSKTKAIIVVHLYGVPCDIEPIMALAEQHDLKVIEDCAHTPGAIYNGKKVGSIGNAGVFSFYPTKNLGALGDGGAVLTNDEALANRIGLIKDHGQKSRDEHILAGRNSRLDTLQAAFLSVKLKYIDQWNEERRKLAQFYFKGLKQANVVLPSNAKNRGFHLFVIRFEKRDELKKYLSENGIEAAIHYPRAIHQIAVYGTDNVLPNSEKAAAEVLSLPLYPGMTEEEVAHVIETINKFQHT